MQSLTLGVGSRAVVQKWFKPKFGSLSTAMSDDGGGVSTRIVDKHKLDQLRRGLVKSIP